MKIFAIVALLGVLASAQYLPEESQEQQPEPQMEQYAFDMTQVNDAMEYVNETVEEAAFGNATEQINGTHRHGHIKRKIKAFIHHHKKQIVFAVAVLGLIVIYKRFFAQKVAKASEPKCTCSHVHQPVPPQGAPALITIPIQHQNIQYQLWNPTTEPLVEKVANDAV